ncbi:hypothetical protein N0M98_27620 [Paenibacillus doosanensis]|uniref:hypothetical protein n=1 Tax=Paenibacillus doosanensis TaxID=1229154 RepID=UPI00217F9F6E|nr:hypothetical protein [Paenibacillus doosanensis]MCS7463881.1 hypothetical protein [Paenibacillus doosanensis]
MDEWTKLKEYEERIRALPPGRPLTKTDLFTPDFLLSGQGDLEMYYAPHNEYVQTGARLLIVGITPGWTQMELAFRQARDALQAGMPLAEAARSAKLAARFSGSMRSNLTGMLDQLGLKEALGLSSCAELFEGPHEKLLHTTSLLRYPLFRRGSNYTGHTPRLDKSAYLMKLVRGAFPRELALLGQPLLVIPLGQTVEAALALLEAEGSIPHQACLRGFPHPSGANGHRHKQLEEHLDSLRRQVSAALG